MVLYREFLVCGDNKTITAANRHQTGTILKIQG